MLGYRQRDLLHTTIRNGLQPSAALLAFPREGSIVTPAERELICAFLQTSHEPGRIETPDALTAWLAEHGLVTGSPAAGADDVRHARRLRAALISLFAANNGADLDPRAGPVLEELSARAPMTFALAPDGRIELRPAGETVAAALVRLAAIVFRAGVDGDYARMKACKKCGWAFFDSSRNRSRTWCDMAMCGAQEKSREYRKRKNAAAG
ncbi:hypothetical protein AYO38_04075 [bacterium SCGC AG-212-C10]|nr:hypothetical protein AYO38_04075 [bacterium SCGC AG-212-C10]